MNVALTGSGGFLGRAILELLTEYPEISVTAFTSQRRQLSEMYRQWKNIIITDKDLVFEFPFEEIDVLINCAFPRNENETELASGLLFIRQLLESAVEGGVGAVINISSQSVYSQNRYEAADENAPVVLESKYAVGKFTTELLTNTICRRIPHTNLRLASLIGAGLEQRIVNIFVKQVLSGQQLHVVGGNQRFGFLDVRDAASGILKMLKYPVTNWKEIYNLGRNGSDSILEIAQCVRSVVKEQGIILPEMVLELSSAWQNSELNCQQFQTTFEWYPQYALKDTVVSIVEAEKNRREK